MKSVLPVTPIQTPLLGTVDHAIAWLETLPTITQIFNKGLYATPYVDEKILPAFA